MVQQYCGEHAGQHARECAAGFYADSFARRGSEGIEKFCREFRGLLKNQFNYSSADELDLMLEPEKGDELNLAEAEPELEFSVEVTKVVTAWKKMGFDALELQCRKVGAPL